MSEVYRLVFRGEVLEGQHPAVVRRRLAQAAAFDDAVLDRLFSGRPVVLKRAADKATAARFQTMFKKAGARLRVMPVEREEADRSGAELAGSASAGAAAAADVSASGGLELLPAGADILRQEERSPWRPRDVDTSDLALEKARSLAAEPAPQPAAPDVSHLTLAQVGEILGPARTGPDRPVTAPELDLAAPGERLGPRRPPPAAPVDFATLTFDVAEPGMALDQRDRLPPPAAPDVSHLSLDDPR